MTPVVTPAVGVGPACTGCGACLRTCPERALRPVHGGLIVLDRCTGCLECIEICPADAITETSAQRPDPKGEA